MRRRRHERFTSGRHPVPVFRLLRRTGYPLCPEGLSRVPTLGGTSRKVSRPNNSRQPAAGHSCWRGGHLGEPGRARLASSNPMWMLSMPGALVWLALAAMLAGPSRQGPRPCVRTGGQPTPKNAPAPCRAAPRGFLSRNAPLDQRTALPDQCLHLAEADMRTQRRKSGLDPSGPSSLPQGAPSPVQGKIINRELDAKVGKVR